jgi:ribosomal protein S18 acetylase RimI-like enzyme
MEPVKTTLSDVGRLVAFFREVWREAGEDGGLGFTGATEETINEIASDEFLRKRLRNPDVNMYIVEEADRVIGFAATRRINENSEELSGIVVLESATGKGLGTRLVERVLSDVREAGFQKIVVKTEVANHRALGFYRKIGLIEVGRSAERVKDTAVHVVILEKSLQ